jgi:uroporphyrinogen decarboxylase
MCDIAEYEERMIQHQPDFNLFRAAITREAAPSRIPTAEVGIDMEIVEEFMGKAVDMKTFSKFWTSAGYDYVLLQVRGQPLFDSHQVKIAEGRLALHGEEATVSTFGASRIQDEESFESYPWIGPREVYYRDVDEVRNYLPDGMKLIVNCGPIFQFYFRAMGIEALSIAIVENPELLNAIGQKAGRLIVDIVENLTSREWVGGIWYGDDMAYTEGLLVSPSFLHEYVFPWLKKIGDICRRRDKLLLFHSDGLLDEILPDLVHCGVQGIHPNEPASVDMAQVKQKWGDRLAVLGGVDLDVLTRGRPADVADATRDLIERVAPGGGTVIGSGNSIAKFVPLANYKSMLETIADYGALK